MSPPIPVDWDALKTEWRERGTDAIRRQLVQLQLVWNSSLDSIGETLKRDAIWLKAFARSGDTSLLAYFVFVWGMSMWELTSDHSKVRENISAARAGFLSAYEKAVKLATGTDPDADPDIEGLREYLNEEHDLVHLILNSLAIPVDGAHSALAHKPALAVSSESILLDAMNVESAVYSGSLAAAKLRANNVVDICNSEVLIAELEKTGGPQAGIRGLLLEVVNAHRLYYGCVALAADALQLASRHDSDAIERLEDAAQALEAAQKDLGKDVYASELPAYRVALTAWCNRLRLGHPTVALDSIDITYLFPFALTGIDGKDAQAVALRYGGWAQFSGLSASEPYELQLTDMWTWGGRRRELNSTISLPLPAAAVELDDDDAARHGYDVELRFNDLGNHYLRVNLRLPNPTLSDINQALRRATTYSGAQRVQSGDQAWGTVADYAKQVILGAAGWIAEMDDTKPDVDERVSKYEFKPDFDYHVVVALDGAHVRDSDGLRHDATQAEILRDYGSLLLQMLNRETTTLDEWICWSQPKTVPNLLGEACFPGDFAVGTESTTVLYMPSTPKWARNGYYEVAEFAASFPPLIYQTRTVLDDKLDRADSYTQSDDDREIDQQELALSRMRTDLHETLENIRRIRTYLVPAQLLSLRAEGAFLDQLYQRSRLPELRDDIDGYLERGRTAIDRINTHEARLHDHRNRKYQDSVQWLLFAVGTFSLSGVATLLLTVYWGAELPGKNTKIDTGNFNWTEAIIVLVGYLAVVALGFWRYDYARRTQLGVRKRRRRG